MDGSEGVGPVRELPIGLPGGGLPVASPGGAASSSRASSATSGGDRESSGREIRPMAEPERTTGGRASGTAARHRGEDPEFARWARGYGVIRHSARTQARVSSMARYLATQGERGDDVALYDLLHALDRVASAGLWLVVHETYARNVYLDGRPLEPGDFKPRPEGHTGGSLNMVPAYAGYLGANALTGITR